MVKVMSLHLIAWQVFSYERAEFFPVKEVGD